MKLNFLHDAEFIVVFSLHFGLSAIPFRGRIVTFYTCFNFNSYILYLLQDLKDVLKTVPEIENIVGETVAQALMNAELHEKIDNYVKNPLRSAFTQLMTLNKEAVVEALSKIKKRLNEENQVGH